MNNLKTQNYLGFLGLGCKLQMAETKTTFIAVDVPSDIIKVENQLNRILNPY